MTERNNTLCVGLATHTSKQTVSAEDRSSAVESGIEGYLIGQLLVGQQRLLQRVGALEARPTSAQKGLPVGSLAPSFAAPALRGEPQTLESLLAAGRPLLLFFFDPECGPCHAYLPQLARWQAESRGRIRFVLLGRRMEGKAEDPAYAPFLVLGQEDREIGKRYLVSSIPSALIVGAEAPNDASEPA